jgi:hypothetical protein
MGNRNGGKKLKRNSGQFKKFRFWRSGTDIYEIFYFTTNVLFCNKKAITSQKACQQCSTNLTDGENNLEIIDFKTSIRQKKRVKFK